MGRAGIVAAEQGGLTTPLCDAEDGVLRRLLPHVAALGITRVADQTGLDSLGIPVVAAFRPNSRSISVHQGKGLTKTAAKVSAIMEAAECHLAENVLLPMRWASADELDDAIDAAAKALPGAWGGRMLWVQGRGLLTGRRRWAPFELVHADFSEPQPPGGYRFRATTNGLGAGLDVRQAQTHALRETIERDAVARWRQAGGPAAADARPLDLGSVRDINASALLDRFRDCRVQVAVWQLPAWGGVAFQALLVPPDGGLAGIEPEMGAAFNPEPAQALIGALNEAAQSRVTRIAGARDDYDPASYTAVARADRMAQAQAWLTLAARRSAVAFPAAVEASLEASLEALAEHGCEDAVWVDLARAELPIACGRMVVPGLEGPFGA